MLPIIPILMQMGGNTCVLGGTPTSAGGATLNTGNWISINMIMVLLVITFAAAVYMFSGFVSTQLREKMKGAAKFEAFQAMVSIAIIFTLIGLSVVSCNIGNSIVQASTPITGQVYQTPMQASESYIGTLMFTKGLGLFTQIYAESVLIAVYANVATSIDDALSEIAIDPVLSISFSPDFFGAMYGFSGALGAAFEPLIVVTFGILFLLYLLLPLVQSLALTVVVPVALIMRTIPFAGPRLRESSDSFLALAIGFYFILPLAILMNQFIVHWIFTGCSATVLTLCNPYPQYTQQYVISTFPSSALFNTNSTTFTAGGLGVFNLPVSFLGSGLSAGGGILSGLTSAVNLVIFLPQVIIGLGLKTAEYVFEGIVLIGIDMAIVLGFAQGLTKGLNSAGRIIGVGPFWGNV